MLLQEQNKQIIPPLPKTSTERTSKVEKNQNLYKDLVKVNRSLQIQNVYIEQITPAHAEPKIPEQQPEIILKDQSSNDDLNKQLDKLITQVE